MQLKYIAYVIGKTNTFNQIFQNQSLPIEKLKTTLVTAYKTILRLCIPLEKITNENIKQFYTFNWEDESVQKKWFFNDESFIEVSSKLPGLNQLKELTSFKKKTYCDVFKSFFSIILNKLSVYLPLIDPVIEALDFVELGEESAEVEKNFCILITSLK